MAHTATVLERNNTNFPLELFEFFKNAPVDPHYSFLKYYQNVVREYVCHADVGTRGILVFQTMGLGKSILAITLAIEMINERQPIVLLTKSLQENMRQSIHKYVNLRRPHDPEFYLCQMSDEQLSEWIDSKFSFVSMNASNMIKQVNRAAEGHAADEFNDALEERLGHLTHNVSLDGKLLIIDEAHNFFRAITNGSKNAISLYNMVMNSNNIKLVFLTGTPIANDPFELVPCFNMLAASKGASLLPDLYKDFNKLYVGDGTIINKERFQNRIFGLVSYATHTSTPGKALGVSEETTKAEFPRENPIIVERVEMSVAQFTSYQLARDKEKEEGNKSANGSATRSADTPSMTKPRNNAASTYRVKSRQLSNYSPPSEFRETGADYTKVPEDALSSPKYERVLGNLSKHAGSVGLLYSQFVGMGGLGTFSRLLKTRGWREYSAVQGGLDYVRAIYDVAGAGGWWGGREKTAIADAFEEDASVTFRYASEVSELSKAIGATLENSDIVFPRFTLVVEENGVPTGAIVISFTVKKDNCEAKIEREYLDNVETAFDRNILRAIIDETIKCGLDPKAVPLWAGKKIGRAETGGVFAIISGEIDTDARQQIVDAFNGDENKHGGVIDLLLVSSTGAEGLDLKNIRHIHILEPYWNWGRVKQIIARGVRNDSHIALPEDERDVTPYIYLSVSPEKGKEQTTDEELYAESLKDQAIILSFERALQEVSIECIVNGGENCRTCSPTSVPLFTDDPARDILTADPCAIHKEQKIKADKFEHNGVEYMYSDSNKSVYGYSIYKFDTKIASFRLMSETDPLYAEVASAIDAKLGRESRVALPY